MSLIEDEIRSTRTPSSLLSVQVAVSGGAEMLILSGELDIAAGTELAATIRRLSALRSSGLTIDLSKLTFIDSTGIAALVEAGRLCEGHGHEFRLIPGPRNVQRVFEITGLMDTLPFCEAAEHPN